MTSVFEPGKINGMALRNRFVCSGIWNGMANEDGSCSQPMIELAAGLAGGNVGLIVTGFAFVRRDGQSAPWQMGAHNDDLLPGLSAMARAVHQAGGRIALQIYHAGLFASPQLTGQEALGPSALSTKDGSLGRAMTVAEITDVVTAFREAAARARKAGFDGVQVHAAHGYLLGQFLSPFFNHRVDEYGGSLPNRSRLLLEVVAGVREAVSDALPVLVKINAEDVLAGGFGIDDMVQVAEMLEHAGVGAVEISGGTIMALLSGEPNASPCRTDRNGPYWEVAARRYRQQVKVPLILVGGIRSLDEAQRLVGEGTADYVSLARPFIMEPALVRRWEAGDTRPSACLSDNACLIEGIQGRGVHCIHTHMVPAAVGSVSGRQLAGG